MLLAPPVASDPSLASVRTIFTPGLAPDFYPIRDLSYVADHWVSRVLRFPVDRVAHFHNVILFAELGLLLIWLLARVGLKPNAAYFVGICWLLHPFHAELVTWISARKDLLALVWLGWASVFGWMASHPMHSKSRSRLLRFAATTAFSFSCFSKASGVLLPLPILLACATRKTLANARPLALATTLIAMLALAVHAHHYSQVSRMVEDYPLHYRLGSSFAALAQMIGGWFWPKLNVLDTDQWPPWLEYRAGLRLAGGLIWAIAVLACIAVWNRLRSSPGKTFRFWLALVLAAYLPVSGLVFPHRLFYSSRYFELPAIAALLGLAQMASGIANQSLRRPILLAVLTLAMLSAALLEAQTWSSSIRLAEKLGAWDSDSPGSLALQIRLLESSNRYTSIVDQIASLSARLDSACRRDGGAPVPRSCLLAWSERALSTEPRSFSALPPEVQSAPTALSVTWPESDRGRLVEAVLLLQRPETEGDLKNVLKDRRSPDLTALQRLISVASLCLAGERDKAREELEKNFERRLLQQENLVAFLRMRMDPVRKTRLEKCFGTRLEISNQH